MKAKINFANLTLLQLALALCVMFGHSFALGDGSTEYLAKITYGRISIHGLALGFFFFLSGFLCTESYRSSGVLVFSLKRILRILPVVAVATIMGAFVIGPLVTNWTIKDYIFHSQTRDYLWNAALLMPVRFLLPGVFDGNAFPGINGCLWVIPWQMLCYIFTAVIGVLGLLKKKCATLLLCALSWSGYYVYCSLVENSPAYYSGNIYSVLKLFCFYISGILFADFYKIEVCIAIKTAFFICGVLILSTHFFDIGMVIVGTLLISYLLRAHKIIITPPPISFGIFVFGFPIQQLITYAFGGRVNHWMNFILSVPVSILVAGLCYRYIEQPCKRFHGELMNIIQCLRDNGFAYTWRHAVGKIGRALHISALDRLVNSDSFWGNQVFQNSALPVVERKIDAVAVVVMYFADGRVDERRIQLAQVIRNAFDKVVIVADSDLTDCEIAKLHPFADVFSCKRHGEYDFGSYKRGIELVREKGWTTSQLVLMNDSCVLTGHKFSDMFDKMCDDRCDAWSETMYTRNGIKHMQSYFMVFREVAVKHLMDFMEQTDLSSDQQKIIDVCELGLSKSLAAEGCRLASYVPFGALSHNPTEHQKKLISKYQVPLIKRKRFGGVWL